MTGFILIYVMDSKTVRETLIRVFRNQHLEGKIHFTLLIKNTKFQAVSHNNEKIFYEHILKNLYEGDVVFLRHGNQEADSDDIFSDGFLNITPSDIKNIPIEDNVIMFPPSEQKIYFSFVQMFNFMYMGNEIWCSGDPIDITKSYKIIEQKKGKIDLNNKQIIYEE